MLFLQRIKIPPFCERHRGNRDALKSNNRTLLRNSRLHPTKCSITCRLCRTLLRNSGNITPSVEPAARTTAIPHCGVCTLYATPKGCIKLYNLPVLNILSHFYGKSRSVVLHDASFAPEFCVVICDIASFFLCL